MVVIGLNGSKMTAYVQTVQSSRVQGLEIIIAIIFAIWWERVADQTKAGLSGEKS